jgi:hypothetical protein
MLMSRSPVAILKVSPASVVLFVVRVPHNSKFPDVIASKIPIATVVAAGIPVKSILALLDVAPLDAAAKAAGCLAYEPPVTCVPPPVSSGATVYKAT